MARSLTTDGGRLLFAATELYGKIIEAKDDSLKNKRTSAIILGKENHYS